MQTPKYHSWPYHAVSLCYACGSESIEGELCGWCRDEEMERAAQFLAQYREDMI